jgi:hypothetical protein
MARVLQPWLDFDRPADRTAFFPGGRVTGPRDFETQLGAFCGQLGCPYLDAFPALCARAAVDNRALYGINDDHLDVEGHRVVAGLVADWIRSDGEIQPRRTRLSTTASAAAW